MNISGSEWSSGCESGWTVYLDESSHSIIKDGYHQSYRPNADDEEDLSMVSDASSGPPHFRYRVEEVEEAECSGRARCNYPPSSSSSEKSKKKKKKAKEPSAKSQHSFLDDTASSPALSYPNGCTDPSNNQPSTTNPLFGFSHENEFKGNPAYGIQFGYRQSSQPRLQDSNEPSRSRGRRRG